MPAYRRLLIVVHFYRPFLSMRFHVAWKGVAGRERPQLNSERVGTYVCAHNDDVTEIYVRVYSSAIVPVEGVTRRNRMIWCCQSSNNCASILDRLSNFASCNRRYSQRARGTEWESRSPTNVSLCLEMRSASLTIAQWYLHMPYSEGDIVYRISVHTSKYKPARVMYM